MFCRQRAPWCINCQSSVPRTYFACQRKCHPVMNPVGLAAVTGVPPPHLNAGVVTLPLEHRLNSWSGKTASARLLPFRRVIAEVFKLER